MTLWQNESAWFPVAAIWWFSLPVFHKPKCSGSWTPSTSSQCPGPGGDPWSKKTVDPGESNTVLVYRVLINGRPLAVTISPSHPVPDICGMRKGVATHVSRNTGPARRNSRPTGCRASIASDRRSQPLPASGPVGLCTSPSPRIARAVAGGLLRRWQQCRHAERKT